MKLTDLDPHFVKQTAPLDYDLTNDISKAEGLQLQCPACYWSVNRGRNPDAHVHTILLWRPQPKLWDFEGTGYRNLTLAAGRLPVTLTAGCRCAFNIRKGKVTFG